jgi:hypothetical protein
MATLAELISLRGGGAGLDDLLRQRALLSGGLPTIGPARPLGGGPGAPGGGIDEVLMALRSGVGPDPAARSAPGPNFGVGGTPDLAALLAARGAPPFGSPGPTGLPIRGDNRMMAARMGLDPDQMMLDDELRRAGIDPTKFIRLNAGSNLTPFPYQPFGTASIGGMDMGGFPSSGVLGSPNPSGDPSDPAGHPSSGILGGGPPTADTTGVTSHGGVLGGGLGNISGGMALGGLAPGFDASGGLQAGLGMTAGLAPTGSGLIGHSDAIGPGPQGAIAVSPSGVVSIGGQAVGVIGGSPAAGAAAAAGAIGGGDAGGIGGIGTDSSSNAGIGGPGGTGVAGGIGAAAGPGAGTGGVGEGEQFGNQFVVPGQGGPDTQDLRLRARQGAWSSRPQGQG